MAWKIRKKQDGLLHLRYTRRNRFNHVVTLCHLVVNDAIRAVYAIETVTCEECIKAASEDENEVEPVQG